LADLGNKPQRRLAKDLGISDVTLRYWLKEEKAARAGRRSSDSLVAHAVARQSPPGWSGGGGAGRLGFASGWGLIPRCRPRVRA
jgi:hypothetical protein